VTTPTPPTNGTTNWGTPLNDYLENTVLAEANQTAQSLSLHAANSPADPHGDRQYALTLMNPILSGANGPNGFLQLTAEGAIPSSLLPTADNWHDLRPVTAAFNATNTGQLPPQYRQTLDGLVRLAGYVVTATSGYNSLVFTNSLPTAYQPSAPVERTVTASTGAVGLMTISTAGAITFSEFAAGLPTGTVIGISAEYPLSAYYDLITS
jgi:hypothetical protein